MECQVTSQNKNQKSSELSPRTQYLIERQGIVWFVWVLLVVLNWFRLGPQILRGELQGNDDYLRLVQIRDWLGGQPWLDLHQYRLNPVDPILMHWSRISDVLIGLPIKFLTPLVGAGMAETIMIAAYPSLMLLTFLHLVVTITTKLTDNLRAPMAAAFMAALSYGALAQFGMGRIDHHSLQIVLALSCLWFIIRSAHIPRNAVYAGIACGLGLYVGIESAPYIAAACVSMVLIWVFGEPNAQMRMRAFGLAMAITTLISLLISTPISGWMTPSCDALSVVYTQLTLAVSLVLFGLSFASNSLAKPLPRFIAAGVLGGMAVVITIALYPQCLHGPYAGLDQRLTEVWLSNVSEAESFHTYFKGDIVGGSAMIILPIFTLFGLWVYHKKTGYGLSLAPRSIFIFMVFCLLAGFVQTRSMAFATSFAIPFAAYLLTSGLAWAETFKTNLHKNLGRMGILILLAPVTIPLVFSVFTKTDSAVRKTADKQAQQCLATAILTPLKQLPVGTALTQIDLGAAILAHTDLKVTTAPYHRNSQGILATIDMFIGNEIEAKNAVIRTQSDYVIACQNNGETGLYLDYAPTGMMRQLQDGNIPLWLEKLDIGQGVLMVYKVNHDLLH